jgi:hypothetical protein
MEVGVMSELQGLKWREEGGATTPEEGRCVTMVEEDRGAATHIPKFIMIKTVGLSKHLVKIVLDVNECATSLTFIDIRPENIFI